MAKLTNYNGSVELLAGLKQAAGGDFPLLEANAVQVNEGGERLDAALAGKADKNHTHAYAASGHTHYKVKTAIESPLSKNTHYYRKGTVTSITLTFPTSASLGDRIFVQFVSGSGISVTLDNAVIEDFNFSPNSVIEIHAVYGIVSADAYGWNAVAYQRKVG
jgi:hypothetical protein